MRGHIESREVDVIVFSSVSAVDLAAALAAHPLILKPLLAACNLAGRAVERDLRIRDLSTYRPCLAEHQCNMIAGFLMSFLLIYLEIPALKLVDSVSFIDKEVRKAKGRWERLVVRGLNTFGGAVFKKRRFTSGGESFELDAASPASGPVEIGIDIKRIEARRDIHKRCDEIANKASRLHEAYPEARFGAVIYYPSLARAFEVEPIHHDRDA